MNWWKDVFLTCVAYGTEPVARNAVVYVLITDMEHRQYTIIRVSIHDIRCTTASSEPNELEPENGNMKVQFVLRKLSVRAECQPRCNCRQNQAASRSLNEENALIVAITECHPRS